MAGEPWTSLKEQRRVRSNGLFPLWNERSLTTPANCPQCGQLWLEGRRLRRHSFILFFPVLSRASQKDVLRGRKLLLRKCGLDGVLLLLLALCIIWCVVEQRQDSGNNCRRRDSLQLTNYYQCIKI